jgi:hypothetical protein
MTSVTRQNESAGAQRHNTWLLPSLKDIACSLHAAESEEQLANEGHEVLTSE